MEPFYLQIDFRPDLCTKNGAFVPSTSENLHGNNQHTSFLIRNFKSFYYKLWTQYKGVIENFAQSAEPLVIHLVEQLHV